jgi:hypothetical protein
MCIKRYREVAEQEINQRASLFTARWKIGVAVIALLCKFVDLLNIFKLACHSKSSYSI